MADWVNNGSCQDLSHLAEGSIVPESMAATNTVSDNHAMTAPGSTSESSDGVKAGDPALDVPADATPPGTDGKPKARPGSADQSRPGWGYVKGGRNA